MAAGGESGSAAKGGDATAESTTTETTGEGGSSELEVESEAEAQFQQVVLGKVDPTLQDLRMLQSRVNRLVETLRPAVVGIRMGGGQGSGVIVTGDGYVLTAAHVVGRKGQKAQIVMPDGATHSATVLGTDASSDSGMLKMDDQGPWPYVEVGESGSLARGQWLMALGHPGGYDPDRNSVVRVGRLLMEPGRTTLQTDCTLVGGDSGGPLFDLEGRVVGIHSRISRRIQQNYHVSVDIFTSQWDDMSQSPRPNLGLSLESSQETEQLIIAEIHRDGPADKAGLKKGDKLLKVNGQAVGSRDELRDVVDGLSLYESIKVVVWRDEAEVEVELVVGVK
jgi:serine protease Do